VSAATPLRRRKQRNINLNRRRPRIIAGIVVAVYIIAGVVVLIAIWTVFIFNHLIRLGNEAKRGWSNIDVQLKRRTDLIPNLVEAVKGYAAHERGVFDEVTAARTAMQQASGPAQAGEANKQATAAIGRLFAVSEAYPALRASENFQKLQDELTDTEDKIAAARRYYNQTVYQYNSRLQSFPDLIVAKLGGFHEREFFALESTAEAALPNVDFSGGGAPAQ
jgi:LemA protein